jgi:hypothetical protein
MKSKLAMRLGLAVGLLMVCGPVLAHHGSQGYDYAVPRKTLKGTVVEYKWQNPHAQIILAAKDDNGNVVNWAMELNNPGNLIGLGWTHASVKEGDELTLTFNPGKEGKPVGICVDVLFADSRKLHASQGCVQGTLGAFDKQQQQEKQEQK